MDADTSSIEQSITIPKVYKRHEIREVNESWSSVVPWTYSTIDPNDSDLTVYLGDMQWTWETIPRVNTLYEQGRTQGLPEDIPADYRKELVNSLNTEFQIKHSEAPERPPLNDIDRTLIVAAARAKVPYKVISHVMGAPIKTLEKVVTAHNKTDVTINLPFIMVTDTSRYWKEHEERVTYDYDNPNNMYDEVKVDDPLTQKELLRRSYATQQRIDWAMAMHYLFVASEHNNIDINDPYQWTRRYRLRRRPPLNGFALLPSHIEDQLANNKTLIHPNDMCTYPTYTTKPPLYKTPYSHIVDNRFKRINLPIINATGTDTAYRIFDSLHELTYVHTTRPSFLHALNNDTSVSLAKMFPWEKKITLSSPPFKVNLMASTQRRIILKDGKARKFFTCSMPPHVVRPSIHERAFGSPLLDKNRELRYRLNKTPRLPKLTRYTPTHGGPQEPKVFEDVPITPYPLNVSYAIRCNTCNAILSKDTVKSCDHMIVDTHVQNKQLQLTVYINDLKINSKSPQFGIHYYTKLPDNMSQESLLDYITSVSPDIYHFYTNFNLPIHSTLQEPYVRP